MKRVERLAGCEIGLRAMRAFAAVMKCRSVTAAGRELGLSQSATSKLLATIESEVGFELFWRDRGRLNPTKDALALFDEVELALAGIERVHSLVHDIASLNAGTLRLGAPPSFAETVVAKIVARFMKRFPRVRVCIDSPSIETTKAMLATRVLDAAFLKTPIEDVDLDAEVLLSTGSICVLRDDDPLAAHAELTPDLLCSAPFVALGTGRHYGDELRKVFRSRKVALAVVAETHTIGMACALVAGGVGVTVLNEVLARPHLRPPIVGRPFRPDIRHDYAFVVSARTAPSRLLDEFRAEARLLMNEYRTA